jgi:ATP-binding cassette, subfamily B, bacterial PglK
MHASGQQASAARAAGLVHLLAASYRLFDRPARRQLLALLALMMLGAGLEAAGAAVIVPFVALINDPAYAQSQPQLAQLLRTLGVKDLDAFVGAAAVALFAFFVAKNLFLTAMASAQFRFVYGQMPLFSCALLERCMHQPLVSSQKANTSVLIRNVGTEVSAYFTNFLIPAMTLITELMVLLAILATLLLIAPWPTVIAIATLGGLTKLFYSLVRSRVRRYGAEQQHHNAERIKWVTQGLGALKEARLLDRESFFIDRFRRHELPFAQAARYAMLLNQTPRLFIETISFAALFLGVAVALQMGQNRAAVLPMLALFAVAAVRLLPSLNRILLSITRMSYYRPAAEVVLDAFVDRPATAAPSAPAPKRRPAAPRSQLDWSALQLQDVAYAYPGGKEVLRGIDLSIERGSSLALVGPSGSGKSTLADLMLGLLEPTGGRIRVDDKDLAERRSDWQSRVGYIPQSTYLLDDSVRRNVAFGLPDDAIDDARVWRALMLARMDDTIRSLPGQLDAPVGENGGRLSGGQRQRLGIARALYDDPEFLVLDEATSALDETTEREIADTLEALVGERTLVVIAHRPEMIRRCQRRYVLDPLA